MPAASRGRRLDSAHTQPVLAGPDDPTLECRRFRPQLADDLSKSGLVTEFDLHLPKGGKLVGQSEQLHSVGGH
jgi:hypothetical protein